MFNRWSPWAWPGSGARRWSVNSELVKRRSLVEFDHWAPWPLSTEYWALSTEYWVLSTDHTAQVFWPLVPCWPGRKCLNMWDVCYRWRFAIIFNYSIIINAWDVYFRLWLLIIRWLIIVRKREIPTQTYLKAQVGPTQSDMEPWKRIV